MPVMDGLEATRRIRASEPPKCDILIIALTANAGNDIRRQCEDAGMNDVITKPLKRAIVVRSAQRALERRALLHENRVLREAMGEGSDEDVVGQSTAWRKTLNIVAQAAPSAAMRAASSAETAAPRSAIS